MQSGLQRNQLLMRVEMATNTNGFKNAFSVREMERAMLTLLDDGRIVANQPIGKSQNRHARYGLVRTSEQNA